MQYFREIIEIKDTIAQTKDKTQKAELKNRLQELKGELKDIKKNITIQNKNNKSQEYKVAECVKKWLHIQEYTSKKNGYIWFA